MLLIYVKNVTNRVEYIFDFFFRSLLRTEFLLTSDQKKFLGHDGPKIAYTKEPVGDAFHIASSDLLFENELQPLDILLEEWKGMKIFFKQEKGDFPFDVFAASFYLITRYEEYFPRNLDRHQRYKAIESIADRGGFLNLPIVHIWANELKTALLSVFPAVEFEENNYTFTPTIDIDNAFAYKHKGILRTTGSWLSLLFSFNFKRLGKRIKVVAGMAKDPYDSYEKQENIHRKYGIHPKYFILLGDYGAYDKNISHDNKVFGRLIRSLEKIGEVGIHPSYGSFESYSRICKEKDRLEKILGHPVKSSRQHYIRLRMPDTYRYLLACGVKEDYSMGYPEKAGFRAGVCVPFYFFDLEKNEKTDLLIHPFCLMETTLKKFHKLRSKEVIPFVKNYIDEVRKVGGNFTFIFHNESIGGQKMWKNWGDMYERIIKLALTRPQKVEIVEKG